MKWKSGDAFKGIRIIHDMEFTILLVSSTYECSLGHHLLATDPGLLVQLPEQEYVPFILFHRSGVTRRYARFVINLTVQGLSFSSIERLIISLRNDHLQSLQLKLNNTVPLIQLEGNIYIQEEESVSSIYKPFPSNDLICKCFLSNFQENKMFYFRTMGSLPIDNYITIDHTFKVAANIGYLRPDRRWITQYGSLFIIMNNIGQVVGWQFTKTSSMDECNYLLSPPLKKEHKCKEIT